MPLFTIRYVIHSSHFTVSVPPCPIDTCTITNSQSTQFYLTC